MKLRISVRKILVKFSAKWRRVDKKSSLQQFFSHKPESFFIFLPSQEKDKKILQPRCVLCAVLQNVKDAINFHRFCASTYLLKQEKKTQPRKDIKSFLLSHSLSFSLSFCFSSSHRDSCTRRVLCVMWIKPSDQRKSVRKSFFRSERRRRRRIWLCGT